ncbi:hypothetical protein APHAL10511_000370 [Amanita phalloides]|nr:hypothetical protein APHAL10511_000370 [Amanita phalloides]
MNTTLTIESALLPFEKIPTCHPHFSSPDADIVLLSVDGTVFRIHSYILRATSAEDENPIDNARPIHIAAADTIPVYETSFLLSYLLPLITGKVPPQPLHSLSLSTLTRLLFLAEKWDTPGPVSQIRNSSVALHLPPPPSVHFSRRKPGPPTGFFRTNPLRIYVLARHFGWREEAERAAASLLGLSMDELRERWEEVQEGKVDRQEGEENDIIMFTATNKDWQLLADLRRRRCEAFKELIDSQERFTAGNNPNYNCVRCGHAKLDNSPWEALKKVLLVELEAQPSGDTLLAGLVIPQPGYSGEATAMSSRLTTLPSVGDVNTHQPHDGLWPELVTCLRAKCPDDQCGAPSYDSLATIKQIKSCVEMLPWKILWDEEGSG